MKASWTFSQLKILMRKKSRLALCFADSCKNDGRKAGHSASIQEVPQLYGWLRQSSMDWHETAKHLRHLSVTSFRDVKKQYAEKNKNLSTNLSMN